MTETSTNSTLTSTAVSVTSSPSASRATSSSRDSFASVVSIIETSSSTPSSPKSSNVMTSSTSPSTVTHSNPTSTAAAAMTETSSNSTLTSTAVFVISSTSSSRATSSSTNSSALAASPTETSTSTASSPKSSNVLTSSMSSSTVTHSSPTSTAAAVITDTSANTASSPKNTVIQTASASTATSSHPARSTSATTTESSSSIPSSNPKLTATSISPFKVPGSILTIASSGALITEFSEITSSASRRTTSLIKTIASSSTTVPSVVGSVVINIRLCFNVTHTPAESILSNMVNSAVPRQSRGISQPAVLQNVTYQQLSTRAFAIQFCYLMSNVTMSENVQIRTDTYNSTQDSINTLMNSILQKPGAKSHLFPLANYTSRSTQITADENYVFNEGDISHPSDFLNRILEVIGLLSTTTTVPLTTGGANITHVGGGFPGWALAIIIPCGILLLLIPLCILLCCLLCAAIKRRWHRGPSPNIQYRIHNDLM
ncbi:uncharacterized protein [Paramormyrops kingsleyae]|uniref:uncharacterized protein n=1 Tax=Paramormyrops kingsleyae TaxID=1676925 RepID=UPI003B96F389